MATQARAVRTEKVRIEYENTEGGRFRVRPENLSQPYPEVNPGDGVLWLLNDQDVKSAVLWFPRPGLFKDPGDPTKDLREAPLTRNGSLLELSLTVAASCPQGNYPYAVYLALDASFANSNRPLHLGGDQLGEGSSHPVIIVR